MAEYLKVYTSGGRRGKNAPRSAHFVIAEFLFQALLHAVEKGSDDYWRQFVRRETLIDLIADFAENPAWTVDKTLMRMANYLRFFGQPAKAIRERTTALGLQPPNEKSARLPFVATNGYVLRVRGPLDKQRDDGFHGLIGLSLDYETLRPQASAADTDLVSELHDESGGPSAEAGDELRRILRQWSPNLPVSLKREHLLKTISVAWNAVTFDPFFAAGILDEYYRTDARTDAVLRPLARIAVEAPVPPEEFVAILRVLDDLGSLDADIEQSLDVLWSQLLRYCLLNEPQLLELPRMQALIISLGTEMSSYWHGQLIRLHLSQAVGGILLPERLSRQAEHIAGAWLAQRAYDIRAAWEAFADPISFTTGRTLEDVAAQLHASAHRCTSTLEARVVVMAFDRCLPLFDTDDQTSQSVMIVTLFTHFAPSVLADSRYLTFMRLRHLIGAFVRLKDVSFLATFEREFLRARTRLIPQQLHNLQLEYAAALRLALRVLGDSGLHRLRAAALLANEQERADSPFFRNTFSEHAAAHIRGRFGVWLDRYISTLARIVAWPMVDRNPLTATHFRATVAASESARVALGRRVAERLAILLDSDLPSPDYCGYAFRWCILSARHNMNLSGQLASVMRLARMFTCYGEMRYLSHIQYLPFTFFTIAQRLAMRLTNSNESSMRAGKSPSCTACIGLPFGIVIVPPRRSSLSNCGALPPPISRHICRNTKGRRGTFFRCHTRHRTKARRIEHVRSSNESSPERA